MGGLLLTLYTREANLSNKIHDKKIQMENAFRSLLSAVSSRIDQYV